VALVFIYTIIIYVSMRYAQNLFLVNNAKIDEWLANTLIIIVIWYSIANPSPIYTRIFSNPLLCKHLAAAAFTDVVAAFFTLDDPL